MKNLLLVLLLLVPSVSQAVTFVEPNLVPAYSATTPHFVPSATPIDMCLINGSATKTIKITSIEVSSNQSTAGTNGYYFYKRSTANTGGTSATMPAIAFDSGYPAATATAQYYTANPTVGSITSGGTLFVRRDVSPISTSLQMPHFDILTEATTRFQPIVLRGVAEGLAVSFNGAALPTGLTINCTFRWTETPLSQ